VWIIHESAKPANERLRSGKADIMSGHGYTKEEIVRLGRDIYEREIRDKVEPEHDGEFVVVDVESGSYEVSESDVEASDRALRKNPDAVLYFLRSSIPSVGKPGPLFESLCEQRIRDESSVNVSVPWIFARTPKWVRISSYAANMM
jgi:hypothetical protein